ncbi:MAG: hypothetical protein WC390_07115 [Sulfurimonas sp.]|jgi:hypothetical protein
MENKIRSISEAYSQCPDTKEVTTPEIYEKTKNYSEYKRDYSIKEIKLENIVFNANTSLEQVIPMYVGYNFNGKKLFQVIYNAVNVNYFINEKNK